MRDNICKFYLIRDLIDTLPVATENGAATLENSFAVPQGVKHSMTMWPRNSTPKCLVKWNENMSKQNLVHGSS